MHDETEHGEAGTPAQPEAEAHAEATAPEGPAAPEAQAPGSEAVEPTVVDEATSLIPGWKALLNAMNAVPRRTVTLEVPFPMLAAAFQNEHRAYLDAITVADKQVRARMDEVVPDDKMPIIMATMLDVLSSTWAHCWDGAWLKFLLNHGVTMDQLHEVASQLVETTPGWEWRYGCECNNPDCSTKVMTDGAPYNPVLTQLWQMKTSAMQVARDLRAEDAENPLVAIRDGRATTGSSLIDALIRNAGSHIAAEGIRDHELGVGPLVLEIIEISHETDEIEIVDNGTGPIPPPPGIPPPVARHRGFRWPFGR